jgi:hypothetical protein
VSRPSSTPASASGSSSVCRGDRDALVRPSSLPSRPPALPRRSLPVVHGQVESRERGASSLRSPAWRQPAMGRRGESLPRAEPDVSALWCSRWRRRPCHCPQERSASLLGPEQLATALHPVQLAEGRGDRGRLRLEGPGWSRTFHEGVGTVRGSDFARVQNEGAFPWPVESASRTISKWLLALPSLAG